MRRAHAACGGTDDPIISSFEPGEDWSWCFIDEIEVVVPVVMPK